MLSEEQLKQLSVDVDNFYAGVTTFVTEKKLPEIPDFEKIIVRKELYTSYSLVITRSNELTELINMLNQLLMCKAKLKKEIRKSYPSIKVTLSAYLDEISDRINIVDKMLSVYKTALENQIRFYQSVQYILSSPRLGGYD